MSIEYTHSRNTHSSEGATAAFARVLTHLPTMPQSLVDVGCGTGTWVKAAQESGIAEVVGVDGILAPDDQLVVPRSIVLERDLTLPLDVGRRFDVAMCLEVAEHIDAGHAKVIIESLTKLSDVVVFSAACPGQPGQHHVNCQWPVYWQEIFNRHGFSCDDSIRWKLWECGEVEPWYRQNMFVATRQPDQAGREPRIPSVMHPDMRRFVGDHATSRDELLMSIATGGMPLAWYISTPCKAILAKMQRRLGLTRTEPGHFQP